jgi:outer membrane protein
MRHTWLLALIAIATVVCLDRGIARADIKIGYVDLQKALNDTDDGKRAKSRLKGIFDKKQKELDAKQNELKRLKEDLDKQRTILDAKAIGAKERDLQEKFVALQQIYLKHQKDLSEEEGKLTRSIFKRMQGIIASIATAEGLAFVFEKTESSILFAKAEFDLTGQVVRRYNAGEGKGGKGK